MKGRFLFIARHTHVDHRLFLLVPGAEHGGLHGLGDLVLLTGGGGGRHTRYGHGSPNAKLDFAFRVGGAA